MIIRNERFLDTQRGPGFCEYCRKHVRSRSPHHVFTRGSGRIDCRFTCLSLCDVFSGGSSCHHRAHSGEIARADLELLLADINGVMQADVLSAVYLIRRLPKAASPARIAESLRGMTPKAASLVREALSKRKAKVI